MNELYAGLRYCKKCQALVPEREIKHGRCVDCETRRLELVERAVEMADRKAVAEAARGFLQAIKNFGSESAAMPIVCDTFLKEIGGKEKLGKMLAEDFRRCRGEGLTPEQEINFEYKDAVIQKYYQMIQTMLERQDSAKSLDASGLTDDDLMATLMDVALENIRHDPKARKRIVQEALETDPDLRKEVMEIGGKKVIESKPVKDELDYTEAGDVAE